MPGAAPTTKHAAQAVSVVSATTTTGSWTPDSLVANNSTTWVFVVVAYAGSAFTDTTTVTGNSMTWTKQHNKAEGNMQLTVFTARSPAGTATAGTNTIVLSQIPTAGLYAMYQCLYTGNVQQAVSGSGASGTTGTATFGSITNGGELIQFSAHRTNEVVTPDASTGPAWTELDDGGTTGIRLEMQHAVGGKYDLTCTATWATSSAWIQTALEMAPASWDADYVDSDTINGSWGVSVIDCESEEGPNVPGNPSGVWAILEK